MQKKYFTVLLYALGLWCLGGGVACAQVTDSVLSRSLVELEVVTDGVQSPENSAVPLQTLGDEDFKRLGLSTAADAVKRMAGVQVQDYGGIGGLKTVSLRGLGANHTGVSYDGVFVSEGQSGQVDIGRFGLDNAAALTLEMGQSDDISKPARAFASAGVVSIKTKIPLATRTLVKAGGGSWGRMSATLLRERVFNGRWSYSAFLNLQRADGDYPFTLENGALVSRERRRDSDIKSLNAEANIFGAFGERGDLAFKIYCFDSERGLPGAVNLYNKNNRERLWDNNLFAQAVYKLPVGAKTTFSAVAKYDYSRSRYVELSSNYATGEQEDVNKKHEFYASAGVHHAPLKNLSLALTADLTHSLLRNNFSGGREPRRTLSQTVAAAQYKNNRLTATASLLATVMTEHLRGAPSPEDRRRLSPSFSLSWQPLKSIPLRLRASVKDGFRLPTVADLYYLRMGNVGLRPERSLQCNAGITYEAGWGAGNGLAISVDGYYNNVKDKIVALPTMYIWRMQNYGRVRMRGVDVNLSARAALPAEVSLLLDATYSYRHTVDYTDAASKNYGHQIPYSPRNTANFSLTVNNRWVNISYLFTAVGKRYMLPQNIAENEIASYVEHSLSANREFAIGGQCTLRLQGELLNFGDANYDVIRYYPMPGRSWRLSACIIF